MNILLLSPYLFFPLMAGYVFWRQRLANKSMIFIVSTVFAIVYSIILIRTDEYLYPVENEMTEPGGRCGMPLLAAYFVHFLFFTPISMGVALLVAVIVPRRLRHIQ